MEIKARYTICTVTTINKEAAERSRRVQKKSGKTVEEVYLLGINQLEENNHQKQTRPGPGENGPREIPLIGSGTFLC